jgi:hypothetical protein
MAALLAAVEDLDVELQVPQWQLEVVPKFDGRSRNYEIFKSEWHEKMQFCILEQQLLETLWKESIPSYSHRSCKVYIMRRSLSILGFVIRG